ncbi:invasion associated locus B family protein [Ochrobactrum quorumnocens]|uniref:Invasion associated locus B family protein n=1 Tax=Ochrobactrum quorumnocens TaxID=271865 RepID=A0A5N1JAZ7_9HYPH|nr:invasion associated locus B family protein [[Ochrobactrum] quorumnocens]KAA9349528.1 Invasion associated locus B family protein [[Ochrobactrum] quorumnocens]
MSSEADEHNFPLCLVLAFVGFLGSLVQAFGEPVFPASAAPEPMPEIVTLSAHVKPPEIALPDGVPLGKYRRIIQPYQNWTLICDENLLKKQKTCNITQSIVDEFGKTIFSWTLAAAQDGRPFFILRFPLDIDISGRISLGLADDGKEVTVGISGCNDSICIGYQEIGPRLKRAIQNGTEIGISYTHVSSQLINVNAPLAGLKEAIDEL